MNFWIKDLTACNGGFMPHFQGSDDLSIFNAFFLNKQEFKFHEMWHAFSWLFAVHSELITAFYMFLKFM